MKYDKFLEDFLIHCDEEQLHEEIDYQSQFKTYAVDHKREAFCEKDEEIKSSLPF